MCVIPNLSEIGTSPCHGFEKSEIQYWALASDALATFRERHSNSATSVGKVNRNISAWPSDSYSEPFETVKDTYKKLSSGLSDLKSTAEEEARRDHLLLLVIIRFTLLLSERSTKRSKLSQS